MQDRRFSFVSMNLPADTFMVVSFSGAEEISKPYLFDILLVSSKNDLDMEDVIEGMARLVFLHKDMDLRYQGIVVRFEQLQSTGGYVFYKAQLAPRLWALGMTSHNQVFLEKSIPEILASVLQDSGILTSQDFEFRLTQNYLPREYVCQYNESHFDFFSRWCEREGFYYFFEQGDRGEKLIVTDSLISHTTLPGQPTLRYLQGGGMEFTQREVAASRFVCEQNLVPQSVKLRDYNYRLPTVDLDSGEANVSPSGMGKVYMYGDNLKSTDEAKRIAKVRAEEARSRQKRFKGKSSAPFVRTGYTFSLSNHFTQAHNATYLAVRVEHEGDQTAFLMSGLGPVLSEREANNYYRNEFTAIPADAQYRPPRLTPRPRFNGTISATVDAQGEGKYAQLDDKGRYKIKLPFDLSGKPDGNASHWIRMAEPYGGADHGMHFPLLKGTEIMLSFVEGDPDRPVITGAVSNFEKPSIVKDANNPVNAIKSARGNMLLMGDREGQEFVGLFSPFHESGIMVGKSKQSGGSISQATKGEYEEYTVGAKSEATLGVKNELTAGLTNEVFIGVKSELTGAMTYSATAASKIEYVRGPAIDLGEESTDLKDDIDQTGINSLTLAGGINEQMENLVSQARRALNLGIGGCLTAGAGAVVTQGVYYPEGILRDADVNWGGLGIAMDVIGAGMAIAGGAKVKSFVKKFEELSSKAKTSEIKLARSGIAMKVNNVVKDDATFTAEVDELGPDSPEANKSVVQITAKGEKIKLVNKEKATIQLEDGNAITIAIGTPDPDISITLFEDGIVLFKKNSAQISMDNNGVKLESLQAGNPGKATLTNGEAKLECGNDAIAVTPNGIKLNFMGGQLHAGTLAINEAGIIQLG